MEDDSHIFLRPQSVKQQFNPDLQANPRRNSMSFSHFVMKFVVIALFLCFIPMFPSEPPKFISDTVFAKSWELIHLLVIGIALSYGLFCRRKNPEQNGEKSQGFQLSNASVHHHPTLFDCGGENPSVKFGKNRFKSKSYDFSGFEGESYVVVRQGRGEKVEESPLGLPVRSLRSRVVESDSEDECVSESSVESESSSFERGEKGENFEGNVGETGFRNGWHSRSMREGFMERGESFEGIMGGNRFRNGWESRSMRAGFGVENGGFEIHGDKGESFEGMMGSNGFRNGWNSRSMRENSVRGDGGYDLHDEINENFEGIARGNGWNSRSNKEGFMEEGASFGVHGDKGENFGGNGWNSRSIREGFGVEKGGFELHCGKGENFGGNGWDLRSMMTGFNVGNGGESLVGNVGDIATQNGWDSWSMKTGFVAANNDFELHCRKGQSFDGNVGSNVLPNDMNSRSMRTDFMAESGNVELDIGKGENLEGNVGNYPPVSLKSRSMRSDFLANNGKFDSDPSKVQSFRSPIHGASSGMMNAGFCSWVPESPNTVNENYSWNPVTNTPFSSFNTQINDFNLVGSTPTSENCTTPSDFFMHSTTTPLPATVPTSDFASGSVMYNQERTSPILENVNKYVESSPLCVPPLQKNEENFIPQTPEAPPSTARPARKFGSSVRTSRRSKSNLGLPSKKSKQQLENDTSVGFLGQGDNSSVSPVVSPVDNVALPANGSFPNKNEDFVVSKTPIDKVTSPDNKPALLGKVPRSPDLKKDNVKMSESGTEIPKHDVIAPSSNGSSLIKDERSTPEKWDDDCFVIPLSEDIDVEDPVQVAQDNPAPELASLSDVASSSSRTSCDERKSEKVNGVEEEVPDNPAPELASLSDVASSSSRTSCDERKSEKVNGVEIREIKETRDFSEIEVYKPSTPSPPPQIQIRACRTDPDIPSSVESSSRALSDGFLLENRQNNEKCSSLTPKEGKSLSKASDSRGFSCTSFFDRDLRRSFRNEAREENRNSEGDGDQYVGRSGKCSCLSLDVRPTLSKAALKGKSVRTIRPREVVPEKSIPKLALEQKHEEDAGRKEQNSEMVLIKIGISEKRPTSSGRKREKQGNVGTSIIVGVNSKGRDSSAQAAVLCDVKEDEPDSEIDKKADEFIAKFKEQIRLQKVPARTESRRRQLPQQNSLYHT